MFEFEIAIKDDHILATTSGTIETNDFAELRNAVAKVAMESSINRVLVDHRKLAPITTNVEHAFEVSKDMAERAKSNQKLRVAGVMNQDGYEAGLFAETVISNDIVEFKAFTNIDKAKAWLGV